MATDYNVFNVLLLLKKKKKKSMGPTPYRKVPTIGSSHCGTGGRNPTSNHEDACLIPGLAQWNGYPVLP